MSTKELFSIDVMILHASLVFFAFFMKKFYTQMRRESLQFSSPVCDLARR